MAMNLGKLSQKKICFDLDIVQRGGGPTQIQIVQGTFFLLWFGHFPRKGGFDPNPKTFEALFCLRLDIMNIFFLYFTFYGQKKSSSLVSKNTGGGVKGILTMSK